MSNDENNSTSFQMLWNCPACDKVGLLGIDHRFCPNCGSTQDVNNRYFPPEGEEVEAKNHEYSGADWICEYCDTASSNSAKSCGHCGAAKDGTQGPKITIDPNETKEVESNPPVESGALLSKFKWPAIGCGGILVLLIGFMIFATLSTSEEMRKIDHHSWKSSVKISKYHTFVDTAFCENMPRKVKLGFKSKVKRITQKKFGTKKVPDGEECKTVKKDKGDGTFKKTKQCKPKYKRLPLYKDYCHFTNVGWKVNRTLEDSDKGMNFKYPEFSLAKKGNCIGCERVDDKNMAYFVHIENQGKLNACSVEKPLWSSLKDGQDVIVGIKTIGGGLRCQEIKAAP